MRSTHIASSGLRHLSLGVALATSLSLAGCARTPVPTSRAERARIGAACPPGSFVAAMASNCPTIVTP